MSEKLKPCHCGAKAYLETMNKRIGKATPFRKKKSQVKCRKNCGMQTREYSGEGAASRAIEAWNTRALEQELVEALQNTLGHINTPISRRKLGIKDQWPEWLTHAVETLAKAEGKSPNHETNGVAKL